MNEIDFDEWWIIIDDTKKVNKLQQRSCNSEILVVKELTFANVYFHHFFQRGNQQAAWLAVHERGVHLPSQPGGKDGKGLVSIFGKKIQVGLRILCINKTLWQQSDLFFGKILWRCSVRLPDWRSPSVDSIDFSTFVHGYRCRLLQIGHRVCKTYWGRFCKNCATDCFIRISVAEVKSFTLKRFIW